MKESELALLKELLATPKKIVIIPHKNPDGDAMGSTLALYQYLIKIGHTANVVTPNDYPKFLKWLPFENTVIKYDLQNKKAVRHIKEAELIFTLDFNALSRVAEMEPALQKAKAQFIMIDHHQQPDDYAVVTYSDTSVCATCQMVYHTFEMLNATDLVDADMATCLYTGIMTDTGSFRFRSTTATTHRVIADLIEKGADNAFIHEKIYDANNFSRLQLLGTALTNLHRLEEFKAAYITLSQEELDAHNYQKGDTEGFVNYGLSLEHTVLALIFIENKKEGIIKISLRSKGDFSVNLMAREHFEGGGHNNAAGGKSDRSLEETVAYFISILPQYKDALNE
ncbi:phosphoesterase RecJ-like protein [Leeuwenhoekiella aestuarii]|uniref:Phosphoesterase RecJ-like protein n=1 Tax=Leeuwenhoekiella aestuarii TaxID=2249426 RepID=A0A4Q0NV56_9FLAO|nr:DHH family phosphoesterase [Leeuwenhoekiella aestuarii]RXG15408.1 phosphoesterase RecJ-like protein [Leeuwenhoekiella aestuarii]RXG17485.1 phosphoesterase RecJ-like protein [Leeuwenhoekiella aestuarii]